MANDPNLMSQHLSAEADRLMSDGLVSEAVVRYAKAAEYEEQVFRSLAKQSSRTRGIIARSWVSLLYKARKYQKVQEAVKFLKGEDLD